VTQEGEKRDRELSSTHLQTALLQEVMLLLLHWLGEMRLQQGLQERLPGPLLLLLCWSRRLL
jgi:hypothetical protein